MNCMQQRCLSMNQLKRFWRKYFSSSTGRFAKNEDGILTVEAIIMFPLLFWSIWASYNFFDGYRQSARNLKAAYALADIVSRERGTVNATYVDTLYDLMQAMVTEGSDMNMRVTFIRFDDPDDTHYVLWSCVRGSGIAEWSDASIGQIKNQLPVMPDNGKMIVVETSNTYERPYKFGPGSDDLLLENFVFTHPRVYDNINMDNC